MAASVAARNYRDPGFLLSEAHKILEFYMRPTALDAHGGPHHSFNDRGEVVDATMRHIVSSTRYVVQFGWAMQRFPDEAARYQPRLAASLAALRRL